MSKEIRQSRMKGLLQEELATLIPGELDDPKLALVAVTDVVVSKDLKNVRVYVNHQDAEVSQREVLSHLNKAMPHLRAMIAERLSTRTVPEITFAYDESQGRAERLNEIFAQIKAEQQGQEPGAKSQATTTLPETEPDAALVPHPLALDPRPSPLGPGESA